MSEFMQFWIAHDIIALISGGIALGAVLLLALAACLLDKAEEGKWEIDVDCEYDVFDIAGERTWAIKATCSECGFTTSFIEGHGVFNYCPNCGADMRGEQDE